MYHADSHCDSFTEAIQKKHNIWVNPLQSDLSRLASRSPFLQYFAIFLNPNIYLKPSMEEYIFYIDELDKVVDEFNLIKVIDSYCINEMIEKLSLAALYSIEGLDCVYSTEQLEILYDKGIRCASLTWNHSNQLATGIGDVLDNGLTQLGKKIIRKAEQLKFILDVSHASPKSFYDVFEYTDMPIIASHSNAKTLCNNPRNLTDEQIYLISERNGYIGINLYPPFIVDNYMQNPARISNIADHIIYINDLAGNDVCGLGCDFDGIEITPSEIEGVQSIDLISSELYRRGLDFKDITKIMGKNLIQFTHKKLSL